MTGEMALEERLVDRDVLDSDDSLLPFHFDDPVYEQERIAVGQIVHDLADIHRRHARAPPRALEGPGQGDVAAVTGPRRYHMSLNPGAGQRQVPHDVRRLVPHELVRPAQFAPVHDAAIVQHDRIASEAPLMSPRACSSATSWVKPNVR